MLFVPPFRLVTEVSVSSVWLSLRFESVNSRVHRCIRFEGTAEVDSGLDAAGSKKGRAPEGEA